MNIHTQIRPIPIFEYLCQSELSTEDFLLMDEYRMMVGFSGGFTIARSYFKRFRISYFRQTFI